MRLITVEFDNTAQPDMAFMAGLHESLSILSTGAGMPVRGAAARGAMAGRAWGRDLARLDVHDRLRLERMLQP